MEFPRRLTENERAILEALTPPGEFRDADVYRSQLDHVTVVGRCPCRCPTIDLRVGETAPRSTHPGVPSLPLWGTAGDPNDPEDVVDLSVWAREGTLTELNVSWYGSSAPAALPDAKGRGGRACP